MGDSLSQTLKRLRLSGLASTLEARLQEAASSGLTHREFLELLLQDELLIRDERQIQRRVTAAGFRDRRTLEDFDFAFNPSVKKSRLYELATGRFLRERYLKPDLLIIDDMGMKQLPKRSGEYLFEIIMRRHEVRSTMMTTNRPLEDWGKLIGDVPSASAILDRFLQHAEIITLTGKSYRLGHRENGPKSAKAPPGSGTEKKEE